MSIALGWARRHAEAFRRLRTATVARGWNRDTHMTAFKLAYTWLALRLRWGTFGAPADRVGACLDCLDAIRTLCDRAVARSWTG